MYNDGKGERRKKKRMTIDKSMDSITIVMRASLEDLKNQIGTDPSGENLPIWLLKINSNLMAYNQSTHMNNFHFPLLLH